MPEDIFVGEGFKKHNLLGLLYFIRDGNLLKTDWFEDECPPSSNLYDPDGYNHWTVIICLSADDRKYDMRMGLQIRGIFLNHLIILYFICYTMISQLENIFVSVMMATTLKFTTVNVAGMHTPERRMQIFKYLLQQGHDIIALQETHCENNDVKLWEKEWNGLSKVESLFIQKSGCRDTFSP